MNENKFCLNCLKPIIPDKCYYYEENKKTGVVFCSDECANKFMADLGEEKGVDILKSQLDLRKKIDSLRYDLKSLENTVRSNWANVDLLEKQFDFIVNKFNIKKVEA